MKKFLLSALAALLTTGLITAQIGPGTGGVPSPLTTKGDVWSYSTDDIRVGIGTNGQVLTADSGETAGLKWSTIAGTGDVVGPGSATDNSIPRYDTTTGKLIQGSSVIIDDSDNLTGILGITATNYVGVDSNEVVYPEIGTATYDDMQDWSDTTQSAGRITGGAISDNGDGTVDVAAGTGIIKTTNSIVGANIFFDWGVSSSLALTDNSANYIYIDYNSGTPLIKATVTKSDANNHDKFLLGKVFRDGTKAHTISAGLLISDNPNNTLKYLTEIFGEVKRASGFVISETGTRNIASTDSVLYAGLTRLTASGIDTSGADTFDSYYYNGSVWVKVAAQSQIDNLQYNNTASGLATLTSNRYGVHWVYGHDDGDILVLYGQGNYSLTNAELAQPPSVLPDIISEFSFLAAKIIIKKSDAAFTGIESAYDTSFTPSGASVHNELAGLQGGTASEYYHFTSAQHTPLAAIAGLTPASSLMIGDGLGSWEAQTPANFKTNNNILDTADIGVSVQVYDTNNALTTTKLDDFGTPDDNTDLNATTGVHGLLPKLGGGTTNFLRADGSWAAPAGGGDVTGPGSATDNAITRFDLTTGKIIQNSGIIIDDSDNITGITNVTGADTDLVSGTAGTNGNVVMWNTDGDAVDASLEVGDIATFSANITDNALARGDGGTKGLQSSGITIDDSDVVSGATISATNTLAGVTMTLGSDADGDVYYRSSNKLTRLAKGTAAQVLTMNAGATAPEWAATGGGGGGISQFDCEVASSGGDYTTVSGAIGGGCYKMILTDNITETSDVILGTTDTHIFIPVGVTYALGSYSIDIDGAGTDYKILVNGGGTITNTSNAMFDGTGNLGTLVLDNLILDNSGAAENSRILFFVGFAYLSNLEIDLPNATNAGLYMGAGNEAIADNINFVGGGSSCANAIFVNAATGTANFNNISFNGTYAAVSATVSASGTADNYLNFSNIYANDTTATVLSFAYSNITNISGEAGTMNINALSGSPFNISNIFADDATIDIATSDGCTITNCVIKELDLSDASANGNFISNCKITDAVSVGGSNNRVSNSALLGGASIAATADTNIFNGIQAGLDAGGGALTITLISGATNNSITGTLTDAAISDTGTTTNLSGNLVY